MALFNFNLMNTQTADLFVNKVFEEYHYSTHNIVDYELEHYVPETGVDKEAIMYCLVHKGQNETFIMVVKIQLIGTNPDDILLKAIIEDNVPAYKNCPKRILDAASPARTDYAWLWRKQCYDNLK